MDANKSTRMPTPGKAKYRRVARLSVVLLLSLGCSKPLPGEGTREAQLYRERCGNCHSPVAPSSMPYATWEMILPRMDQRIGGSGQAPLTPEEHQTIEAYLKKNAG
jgi:diheme cytochrome c